MKVYDTVNRLAEELKSSDEYINFKNIKQKIALNTEYKEKISKFNQMRYEEQLNSMQTGKTDENKMQEIQNLYKELIGITDIKEYFEAELKFNILLADVNKIISEAVRDVISD